MKHKVQWLLLTVTISVSSLSAQSFSSPKRYGEISLEESTHPVHPGIPGKVPFWNQYSKQFLFAPAFDFRKIEGAADYRFDLYSEASHETYSFVAKEPYAALSPVWARVPVGFALLKVTAMAENGEKLGISGERRFYRAAWFDGEYHEPVMGYSASARLALDSLMQRSYVRYWLTHHTNDPAYNLYRYPSKIFSALVIGAIIHAKLWAGTPREAESKRIAVIVADHMLGIRFKPKTPWEYQVPTYLGYQIGKENPKGRGELTQTYNHMTTMGVDAGYAFLDLYDYTGDKKYFDAAIKIKDTYLKNQLPNGTWYLYVNVVSGKPFVEHLMIPTSVINYFDRLRFEYGVKGLEQATRKALEWTMENPVKTYDWHGQFEDVKPRKPYENLSREQACELAMYLMRNKNTDASNLKLAEELIRFSEDQLVIWEKPMPYKLNKNDKNPGNNSQNWITPSVQEQLVFWMPVARAASVQIETYIEAYEATKNDIYLAKAKSLANSITIMQEAQHGNYLTMFIRTPWNDWLNSQVYPARVMMLLENELAKIHQEEGTGIKPS